jgi:HK97 family phage major capsid protein
VQVRTTGDISYEMRMDTRGNERAGMILRAMEGLISDGANQRHFEGLVRRHAVRDVMWARNILARSNPVYDQAWRMVMSGNGILLNEEQRAAIAVGTGTQGGFLVPTHLDPTLIITNSGSSNIVRSISRVVTLTQENVWHGVSTAGVTASWDAELAEVSDDSPTFLAPNVPVYGAQVFVQATLDALADTGIADEVLGLFADARDRLEGAAHAVGSGVGQPTGIFTALDANTNVEITSTTAATIGLVDIHGVYRAVPVRWRGKSTWLMNPLYSLAIKALGTALSASYSTDITQPVADRLIGRPLVESDDAPTTQTTTALDNELVFGDFSNFVVVDKPGSTTTQYIPTLFNTANNLPDGRVGWYMRWRNGSDSVNDLAFRLLQDKTSA